MGQCQDFGHVQNPDNYGHVTLVSEIKKENKKQT